MNLTKAERFWLGKCRDFGAQLFNGRRLPLAKRLTRRGFVRPLGVGSVWFNLTNAGYAALCWAERDRSIPAECVAFEVVNFHKRKDADAFKWMNGQVVEFAGDYCVMAACTFTGDRKQRPAGSIGYFLAEELRPLTPAAHDALALLGGL